MKDRYLEVTYRHGKPFAAYLYLPRQCGARSVRTEKAGQGILIDYGENGSPIGLEITAPESTTIADVNEILHRLDAPPMPPEDLAPLPAA